MRQLMPACVSRRYSNAKASIGQGVEAIFRVIAYAATAGSAEKIRATLIYPVRRRLYEDLQQYNRAETLAIIPVGRRQITLRMKAVAFESA